MRLEACQPAAGAEQDRADTVVRRLAMVSKTRLTMEYSGWQRPLAGGTEYVAVSHSVDQIGKVDIHIRRSTNTVDKHPR